MGEFTYSCEVISKFFSKVLTVFILRRESSARFDIIKMADMKKLFSGDVPIKMKISGSVEDADGEELQKFRIDGEGIGNAVTGYQYGKWVCSSGTVPISWEALSVTFGYGYKCFTKFQEGVKNFFVDTFPEGYSQIKTLDFENDGTLKVNHTIYVDDGVVMNDVIFRAIDFKPNSPVLNDGIRNYLPSIETYFDIKGGIKSISTQLYPLKKPSRTNKYAVCHVTNVHKPINPKQDIDYPGHHYVQNHAVMAKDANDNKEEVYHYEGVVGFTYSLLGADMKMKV